MGPRGRAGRLEDHCRMTNDRYILVVGLCVVLCVVSAHVLADSPIINPSFEAVATVTGELVTLQNTSQAPLAHTGVIPSSVVVRNSTGTITYVHGADVGSAGSDYVLYAGSKIGRTTASTIPNGATVKVSYSYCVWQGWTPYSYSTVGGSPGDPSIGATGTQGTFDVLIPSPASAPNGVAMCGSQAWGNSFNGGVRQTFNWVGGAATISLTARAYSQALTSPPFQPWDNGCRVRMGLVPFETTSRDDVTDWVTFPWGSSWSTMSLSVPGWGTYTLFIEAYQPNPQSNAIMSTLWDNVVWSELPLIAVTSGPTVVVPGDPGRPDSTARIEWTTDVPSTSRVAYGASESYGLVAEDTQLTTQHSVLLTDLTPSSAYHFQASSSAPGYSDWVSVDGAFELPIRFWAIATTPSPDGSGMVISWKTDVPTTSRVEYGPTASYGSSTEEDPTLVTEHEVTLTDLVEDSDYHFRLWARNDPLYSPAASGDQILHTLPVPGTSLQNGSFEQGRGAQQHSIYPWVQYSVATDVSGYHPIDGLIGPFSSAGANAWFAGIRAYDGSYFVGAAANYDYKNGGVLQRVFVPSGQPYTFSVRYATYQVGGTTRDTRLRLGIDPTGGVDPQSPNVRWRSVFSPTNDNRWHVDAITATAGSAGLVTVFLDIQQRWPIEWHVVAADDARLGPPVPMTIGQLKSSDSGVGAVLSNEVVTYSSDLDTVTVDNQGYRRVYIEEEDGSAGIAVLLDQNRADQPLPGNKITVTGSIVLHNMEAMLLAYDWSVDPAFYDIPKAKALSQRSIGGSTPVQPALRGGGGACNVGLRVRVFGRVVWSDNLGPFSDSTVVLDDGSGLMSGRPPGGGEPVHGVMVKLRSDGFTSAAVGDYLAATGVLGIRFIDPNSWPDTGDEYYTYFVSVAEPGDWNVISAAGQVSP